MCGFNNITVKEWLIIKTIDRLNDIGSLSYSWDGYDAKPFNFELINKCKKIVREILPEMNLVIGEYTFDESKLIFYFTAENRLDFRELVKEVNKTFKKRVEFYQIKQNDEGRILSAFGKYGKEIYW